MKGTGISDTVIRNTEPSSARRGSPRAGRGVRAVRAVLGAALAGTALLGLAALVAGCPLCNGNDMACSDGVTLSGPIGLPVDAPARIEVRACRNGSCAAATVSAEPRRSPSVAGTTGTAGAEVEGGGFGFTLWDVDATNTQWEISISYSPDLDTELNDGDVYTVSIVEAGTQRELVSFEGSISYEVLAIDGDPTFCTSCDVADIKLPPPAAQ